jgi:ABC-type dipeptide/oligopeptide/nickel transport system permease component
MLMSGFTMRLTRSMIPEVLRQDCVRITWTKGLRERAVTELIIALS